MDKVIVLNKIKPILTKYGNDGFIENVEELLLYLNKEDKSNDDIKIINEIIKSVYAYNKNKSEDNLYLVKDNVIKLYNYLLV